VKEGLDLTELARLAGLSNGSLAKLSKGVFMNLEKLINFGVGVAIVAAKASKDFFKVYVTANMS
jgi:lambda repressor-like predicted transcriptional regulator